MQMRDGKVSVKISGITGTGKSAIYTEIATALTVIGVTVEHADPKDAATEMRMNGLNQLEMYKPTVVLSEHNISRKRLETRPRQIFRLWRAITFRDNCETCDGRDGVRGNENIVDGVVMCDYCHANTL